MIGSEKDNGQDTLESDSMEIVNEEQLNIVDHVGALRLHVNDLIGRYSDRKNMLSRNDRTHGSIVVVNLIDKHGAQGKLGRVFAETLHNASSSTKAISDTNLVSDDISSGNVTWNKDDVNVIDYEVASDNDMTQSTIPVSISDEADAVKSTPVRYIWFDFHRKCKGGKTGNLLELFPPLKSTLMGEAAFFCMIAVDNKGRGDQGLISGRSVARVQQGVIRTNCIDCLDRTNVVQVRNIFPCDK